MPSRGPTTSLSSRGEVVAVVAALANPLLYEPLTQETARQLRSDLDALGGLGPWSQREGWLMILSDKHRPFTACTTPRTCGLHSDRPHAVRIGEAPSSSASCPSIVAVMLAALDAQEGNRVLEIGTGTGYNAALLAHRLGAEQVTTMEIDPQVAAQAREALSDLGFGAVTVITGDGELGYPLTAPYDRVICTAACENIPYPWVAQTKPGGLVLIPWKNSYFDGGLVALRVNGAGTAAGTIVGPSSFMWLRQQRTRHPGASPIRTADGWDRATISTTELHPHYIAGDYDAQFTISQRVPKCRWRYSAYDQDEHEGILWLLDYWSGSWASLTYTTPDANDDEFKVRQFGPRQLWDEAEAAHRWWIEHGSPPVDRWRFTVTPEGQWIELT